MGTIRWCRICGKADDENNLLRFSGLEGISAAHEACLKKEKEQPMTNLQTAVWALEHAKMLLEIMERDDWEEYHKIDQALAALRQVSTEDWLDNVIADDRLPPNHAVINGKLVCFNAPQPATGEKK